MEPVLIAIIGTLLFTLFLRGTAYMAKPKAIRRYKPHYVRELEQKELGYVVTKCGNDKCKTCNPTPAIDKIPPKAIPSPPKGPGGVSPVQRRGRCSNCHVVIHNRDRDTCQTCTLEILKQRKATRGPRARYIEHDGVTYKAHMPNDVPDNAHAEIVVGDGHKIYDGTWAVFKWTDFRTGKQMFLKTSAFRTEPTEYEVMSDQSNKPVYRYWGGL